MHTAVEGGDAIRDGRVVDHPAWPELKSAVEEIRPWQSKDGSIDFEREGAPTRVDAEAAVDRVISGVEALAPLLPHDEAYHRALVSDLRGWVDAGFVVPDFLDSLLAFQPAARREDGLQHLVVFPMYTQNGNPDRNFEAVVLRMVWPEWLAELERTRYDNPLFCGITFEDFTAGYDTNSAVLFPETIAVREAPSASPGAASSVTARRPASAASPSPPWTSSASSCPPTSARCWTTRTGARRPSSCGTWCTTAPTATATCRSTPS
ncbi:hypothetical protein SMD44_01038 [Streptomyces alboflavus]|uniref:Uncharacterized protein n=1 Tax=Streptomyces alboflavus TaxID=67267 RepID=A0A1Z1W5F5_9ACTN|nr:hypothetical protein SMD44_01038 [Streptomyces alboflavus]